MHRNSPDLTGWLGHLEWADRMRPVPGGVCPLDAVRSLERVPPGCTAEDWMVPGDAIAQGVLRLLIAPGAPAVHVLGLSACGEHAEQTWAALLQHGLRRAGDLGVALAGTHEVALPSGETDDLPRCLSQLPAELTWHQKVPFGVRQIRELTGAQVCVPAVPDGYRLITWGTTTPRTYLRACARLERTMNGEEYAEPATEQDTHTYGVERMRRGRGRHAHHTGVLDGSTGELVGFSSISVTASVADHAYQGMTVVHPDHRGRRLATLLKVANLRQLQEAEPQMRRIETANDHDNVPMLALNRACGFRAVSCLVPWKIEGAS